MSRLIDGFPTLMLIGNAPVGFPLWELRVTPPSVTGGGPINVTSMRNTALRTQLPKKLKSIGNILFNSAYDPVLYSSGVAIMQINTAVTTFFSDASNVVVMGWLEEFAPKEVGEGEQPDAACMLCVSNLDVSSDPWVEVGPVYSAP